MRSIRTLFIGILFGLSFSVEAVDDYTDHVSICEAVAASRTHAWAIGEKEKYAIACPCELKKYEEILEPFEYRAVVDWKIDSKAFAKNLPEGIKMGEFMSKVLPLSFEIEKACR